VNPSKHPLLQAQAALTFSHMGFFVLDAERMANYYQTVLGFTITDRGLLGTVPLIFLSRDPSEHHQIVLAGGKPEGLSFNAINQISFRVQGLDVLRAVKTLAEQDSGTTEMLCVTHGNAISIYFRDPEGNRIEAFVDTPWYCEQPLREVIDLNNDDDSILAQAERIARNRPKFQLRSAWQADMARRMGYANF
jgi:catechol-2,3-dioxygenase